MPELNLLSVVALTEDLPVEGLFRGQVGTIVELLAPDVFEVEFVSDLGETYALAEIPACALMRLHHKPVVHAA